MKANIEFTRINNDINGNPRYVCHFLDLCTERDTMDLNGKYEIALKRSRQFGGRKYHTKSFGGGIVFQSYNIGELEREILEFLKKA